jgi:hypothetical protein
MVVAASSMYLFNVGGGDGHHTLNELNRNPTNNQLGQPRSEGFEKRFKLFWSYLKGLYIWWASLYSRALTTVCVDEVPAPRSRPTTPSGMWERGAILAPKPVILVNSH